jgi:hypothetical protein
MSFTQVDELVIREGLKDKLSAAGISFPLPSPLLFESKAEFWATVDPQTGKDDVELTLASLCVVTLRKFEDVIQAACEDQPLIRLTYNLYLFREIHPERMDETETPDDFDKLLLKAERDFLTDFFSIRAQFVGLQPWTGLPTGYSAESLDISMDAFIRENDPCRHIPDIKGFSADLQTTVEVLING